MSENDIVCSKCGEPWKEGRAMCVRCRSVQSTSKVALEAAVLIAGRIAAERKPQWREAEELV